MRKYIDIRISGLEDTLIDFLRVLRVIQKRGERGRCRKISVVVDGDGSGRLAFRFIEKDGKFRELDTENLDLDKIETEGKLLEEMWIGE